jgi:TPR repeat protein
MIDYIKEAFHMFTNDCMATCEGDLEIHKHYQKLQNQAKKGLLDNQLLKITPHNDLADLFEEFHNIRMVEEEESKSRFANKEAIQAKNAASIGSSLHNKLIKSTTLKLKEMNNRAIWSVKSIQIIDGLINSEMYEKDLETSKKYKSKLGKKFDYIWLDDNHSWYWLATGCVNAMIATHYRIMLKTGMRTIYGSQTRNIGELVVDSLKLKWTDDVYDHLGAIAMTAVVLGDLPLDTKLEIKGMFGAGPRGVNFQAATLIPAKNAPPIFDKENFPKEPCVGMSMFYLENEPSSQYEVTSDTLSGLHLVFGIIQITFPKVRDKEWLDSVGHSVSIDEYKEEIDEYKEEIDEYKEEIDEYKEEEVPKHIVKEKDKEWTEELTSFHKKAFEGDKEAQGALGWFYFNLKEKKDKESVSTDEYYEKAVFFLTEAAKQGHDEAQVNLGKMYLWGTGVDKDVKLTIDWWCKSAKQGYDEAEYQLGLIYLKDEHVTQDYEQAIYWFTRAAEQGHANAQVELGLMFHLGQAIAQDYEKALTWFKKAAEQGDSFGQNNVGSLYRDGEGIAVDYEKAFVWFNKAAEQKNVFAQHSLGEMYLDGLGVKKSLKDAAYWLNMTRNNPDKDTLTEDDLDQLEKLWKKYELWKYIE